MLPARYGADISTCPPLRIVLFGPRPGIPAWLMATLPTPRDDGATGAEAGARRPGGSVPVIDLLAAAERGAGARSAMSGQMRPTADRDFVIADEIRRREHEHLAHHVRILLVSAHEPDHPPTSRVLDHSFKTSAHQLLKRHPLGDHRRPASTVKQRLLDPRKAASQHTDHQVVFVVGLRLGRPATVEFLQQRDQTVRHRRQHVTVVLRSGVYLARAHSAREYYRGAKPRQRRWSSRYRRGGARLVLAFLPDVCTYSEGEREGRMSAPAAPLTGDELYAAVTDAMVAFHQRYYHRAPVTAKTSLLGDDLLACVLGGVYTDVEKTMIEIQRKTMVQETRNAFQNTMQAKFINTVERLSGRQVMAFFSDHHVGPDIEIELFLFTPSETPHDETAQDAD